MDIADGDNAPSGRKFRTNDQRAIHGKRLLSFDRQSSRASRATQPFFSRLRVTVSPWPTRAACTSWARVSMMPEQRKTPPFGQQRGDPGGQGDDNVGHDVGQHQGILLPGQFSGQGGVGDHVAGADGIPVPCRCR